MINKKNKSKIDYKNFKIMKNKNNNRFLFQEKFYLISFVQNFLNNMPMY